MRAAPTSCAASTTAGVGSSTGDSPTYRIATWERASTTRTTGSVRWGAIPGGGYVFLNPRPDEAPPLREYLGGLVERLDPFRMENQRLVAWHTVEIDCNWKVLTEAFLETYHVPGIHPNLVTVLDETNTGYEHFGIHSRMWIPYGLPSVRYRDTTQQVVYESYLHEHFRERHLDWSGVTDAPDAAGWEPDFDGEGDIPGGAKRPRVSDRATTRRRKAARGTTTRGFPTTR